MNIRQLEKRLNIIENRNKRVELDKAWEVSYLRRALLIMFTYLSIGLYMWAIGIDNALAKCSNSIIGVFTLNFDLAFFQKLVDKDKKVIILW